jgi:hypothetical protein
MESSGVKAREISLLARGSGIPPVVDITHRLAENLA